MRRLTLLPVLCCLVACSTPLSRLMHGDAKIRDDATQADDEVWVRVDTDEDGCNDNCIEHWRTWHREHHPSLIADAKRLLLVTPSELPGVPLVQRPDGSLFLVRSQSKQRYAVDGPNAIPFPDWIKPLIVGNAQQVSPFIFEGKMYDFIEREDVREWLNTEWQAITARAPKNALAVRSFENASKLIEDTLIGRAATGWKSDRVEGKVQVYLGVNSSSPGTFAHDYPVLVKVLAGPWKSLAGGAPLLPPEAYAQSGWVAFHELELGKFPRVHFEDGLRFTMAKEFEPEIRARLVPELSAAAAKHRAAGALATAAFFDLATAALRPVLVDASMVFVERSEFRGFMGMTPTMVDRLGAGILQVTLAKPPALEWKAGRRYVVENKERVVDDSQRIAQPSPLTNAESAEAIGLLKRVAELDRQIAAVSEQSGLVTGTAERSVVGERCDPKTSMCRSVYQGGGESGSSYIARSNARDRLRALENERDPLAMRLAVLDAKHEASKVKVEQKFKTVTKRSVETEQVIVATATVRFDGLFSDSLELTGDPVYSSAEAMASLTKLIASTIERRWTEAIDERTRKLAGPAQVDAAADRLEGDCRRWLQAPTARLDYFFLQLANANYGSFAASRTGGAPAVQPSSPSAPVEMKFR